MLIMCMCDELVTSWCFRVCIWFNFVMLCRYFFAVIFKTTLPFLFWDNKVYLTLPYLTLARLAIWNIRTMCETGKTIQVAREMKKYKIGVLGLSETRWLQSGQLRLSSGKQLLYSGHIEDGAPPSPPTPPTLPILRVWLSCWYQRHMLHSSAGSLSTPASSQPSLPPRRKTSGWTSSSAMLPQMMRMKRRKMTSIDNYMQC